MKKIYVTPSLVFEEMEGESLLFETSSARVTNRTQDPSVIDDGEIKVIDDDITVPGAPEGESDD